MLLMDIIIGMCACVFKVCKLKRNCYIKVIVNIRKTVTVTICSVEILRSRAYMKELQSGCVHGSATHALLRLRTQIYANRYRNTCNHRHNWRNSPTCTQSRFTSYLWILMLMLLISMLSNSCSGTRAQSHIPNFDHIPTLPHTI